MRSAATRLQVEVSGTRNVPGPAVQFDVGASQQVDPGLPREEDQVEKEIAVFGLDVLARLVGTTGRKLIQEPLDVSKGYFAVFLGHQEP
jgi:hypothetical protein